MSDSIKDLDEFYKVIAARERRGCFAKEDAGITTFLIAPYIPAWYTP